MARITPATDRPRKGRHDIVLAGVILVVVALIAFFVCSTAYFMWYQTHFRDFISALSDSTVYAYQNDCLTARQDGQEFSLEREKGYQIYNLLTKNNGKLYRRTPDEPAALTLDYGDGAVLELWPVELEEGAEREVGVFWRFVSAEGKVWMYDTDKLGPQILQDFTKTG